MVDNKTYRFKIEQKRMVTITVEAPNLKSAKLRAEEHLWNGGVDDGFSFPPKVESQFNAKIISWKETTKRGNKG